MSPPDSGIAASRLQLPRGDWATVLDCLCARFPRIDRARWLDRMQRGRVLDADGRALEPGHPYRVGLEVQYFREVAHEPAIPFRETIVHIDEDLVVADKPHFLPAVPKGRYVAENLLTRLMRTLGEPGLAPLHRLDRATAGLVMFSRRASSRAAYHALFSQRRIEKGYEAIAAPLPDLAFPHVHRSRLVAGEPFFRMREAPGTPNSETRIEVLERGDALWRYALWPVTGRTHQLRVHLAALGAPILHDHCYPELGSEREDDHARPMQLLARSLRFVDPLTGVERRFESTLRLMRL